VDSLGNYSDYKWFQSLNKEMLIVYIKELCDIWHYRAQITDKTKYEICPFNGNPFRRLNMGDIYREKNITKIKKCILEVMENLVINGINKDSKALGAYYILGALTLVNESARSALPWLYQSFGYF
jgi:hypothetical protein